MYNIAFAAIRNYLKCEKFQRYLKPKKVCKCLRLGRGSDFGFNGNFSQPQIVRLRFTPFFMSGLMMLQLRKRMRQMNQKKFTQFLSKFYSILVLYFLMSSSVNAQITTNFYGRNTVQSDGYTAALYRVDIYDNRTDVTVELKPTRNKARLNYWSSYNTWIIGDGYELMIAGFLRNGKIDLEPFSGNWGWSNVKTGESYKYTMVFLGRIPAGCTNFTLKDKGDYNGSHGFGFSNYTINNPDPCEHTGLNEYSIKQKADAENDGIVGVYEGYGDLKYKLGVVKSGSTYKIVYLGGANKNWWHIGDVKAILRESATPGVFKADWYMLNKSVNKDCYIFFDGGSMKTIINGDEDGYLKMYPTSSGSNSFGNNNPSKWSGSGFALKDGYLVTNYHVIEGANTITIKGVKGDFSIAYKATVVASDKYNDLALLKINDSRFYGFGQIPYSVKMTTVEVGNEIFVLGYPLTATMGDEIKYTTGVISSKTGFQGDVSLYQISAPIQPGNSGGPLFDSKGCLIGIVNAKHVGAENVGYAIKSSYLRNLIESYISTDILPGYNTISTLTRPEQISAIKKYVFLIECSK